MSIGQSLDGAENFIHTLRGTSVVLDSDFHDRFLVLDDRELYHIGASLKDAGEKSFAITRLAEPTECEKLLSRIGSIKAQHS